MVGWCVARSWRNRPSEVHGEVEAGDPREGGTRASGRVRSASRCAERGVHVASDALAQGGPRRRAARRGGAREGEEGHRDSGESLSAVGPDARYREREEHRAMIEELTPIIGTRPACDAVDASPATIYRRRRPPEPRSRGRAGRGSGRRTTLPGSRARQQSAGWCRWCGPAGNGCWTYARRRSAVAAWPGSRLILAPL